MTVFGATLQVKLVGPFFKLFATNSSVLMVQHVFIPPVCDCRIPYHFRLLLSTVQEEQHRNRLCAFVSPRVACTVLYDHVTALEMNGLGVIKLKPNFTVVNYGVVHGVRLMHGRIFLFKVIC